MKAADSDLLVVINVRSEVVHLVVGGPSNTAVWQTRCGFRYGGSEATCPFLTP